MEKRDLLVKIAQLCARTHTNIAESYVDWLSCCFCCASFGEEGREPLHLIASQSSKYKREDNDKQFDICRKSVKDTDNLSPLLSLCKTQGLMLRDYLGNRSQRAGGHKPAKTSKLEATTSLYDFPRELPSLLANILPLAQDEGQGYALMIASICACASVLDGCNFMYAGRLQHLNLYSCCVAPAASGKSILSVARDILRDVHDYKRKTSESLYSSYRARLKELQPAERELEPAPPLLSHYLPADTSVSALLKTIADNDGGGIIWESELDTLTRNFRSDYGNFSDGLRNNWGGESISYNRKTNRELLEISDPHFCCVVSCTPLQVPKFFGSAENGLFSRFLFSRLPTSLEWRSQWDAQDSAPIVSETARALFDLYQIAKQSPAQVIFNEEQRAKHTQYFDSLQMSMYGLLGDEMLAVVRRAGVAWGRIVSVLCCLHAYSCGAWVTKLYAYDWCCDAAYCIIERAVSDCAEVLLTLPAESATRGGRKDAERQAIYNALPSQFDIKSLPQSMGQASKYRLLRLWLDEGLVTKDGTSYNKIN